jgi:hypothetical protein
MIQKIILFFLLGGILLPMHAQINGTVVDSESNPISFANVALYTVPDSMLIAGTITNREGHFSLNTENQIDAFIKVSFIGFDLRSTYLQTENTDLRQQLNMNYRNNGWDLFGTLKYERYAYLQESIIRQSTYVDTLWTQENQLRVDGLSNPLTVVAGINYEFSPKQQAGVKYTLTTFPGKNRDIANTISDVYANGSFYDRLVSQDHQQQDLQPRHRLNGYYCGTFGKLTVDFNGDFYRSIQTTRSNITETSEEQDDRTIGSDNRIFNRLFATRTILTHPLLGGTLSVGNEFTRTHREDDYQTSNPMIPSSATEIHDQNLSFFAEYSRATPVGQITAGLRYEDVFWDYFRDGERNDELLAVFTAGGILETGEECHHPVGRTDGGEPAVTLLSNINIRQIPSLFAFLTASPKFGIWSPQASVGFIAQRLEMEIRGEQVQMNRPLPIASFNNSFSISKGFLVTLDSRFQGKGFHQNFRTTRNQYIVDAGITKSFFEDKLSLTLKGHDLFHGRKMGIFGFNDRLDIYQYSEWDSREMEITVRYKFNAAKNRYKGNGVGDREINRMN